MFYKEIIETGWIDNPSTLAIIVSFNVYNPNLMMYAEKTFTIEFL